MIHHESFIFTLSPFCLFKFKEFYTNKQTRVHWPSHVWLVTDVFLMNVICFQHHVDNSEQDFSNVVSALMICVSVCVCRSATSWSKCYGDAVECSEWATAYPESSHGAMESLQVLQCGAETQQTWATGITHAHTNTHASSHHEFQSSETIGIFIILAHLKTIFTFLRSLVLLLVEFFICKFS